MGSTYPEGELVTAHSGSLLTGDEADEAIAKFTGSEEAVIEEELMDASTVYDGDGSGCIPAAEVTRDTADSGVKLAGDEADEAKKTFTGRRELIEDVRGMDCCGNSYSAAAELN